MPIATPSLVPYNQTIFTAVNGTQYKGQIDAATAIASNVAGNLYVYPNNPAGMSVLVDDAFNLTQIGLTSPFLLNGASSSNTVALAAPGSNSYYATVYFDTSTSTTGAVYGATSVTPTPVLPDKSWQIPLAVVLISSTTTSITAANILDVRSFICPQPLSVFLGTITTNQTVNCQQASLVSVAVFVNAFTSISFTNLQAGIPIFISMTNVNAGSVTTKINASTPGGLTYTVNGHIAGTSAVPISMTATGFSQTTGATNLLIGNSVSAQPLAFTIA